MEERPEGNEERSNRSRLQDKNRIILWILAAFIIGLLSGGFYGYTSSQDAFVKTINYYEKNCECLDSKPIVFEPNTDFKPIGYQP